MGIFKRKVTVSDYCSPKITTLFSQSWSRSGNSLEIPAAILSWIVSTPPFITRTCEP